MSMPESTGIFDPRLGYVLPPSTGQWSMLSTWSNWTSWEMYPSPYLDWALDPIDLGAVKTFNLKILTRCQGLASYTIYTSDTGDFTGEETITVINQGDSGITAFSGQYVWIKVTVDSTGGPPILYSVEFNVTESVNRYSINNLDTSTINDGSSQGYVLPITRSVGTITNVQITPREVQPFQLDVYVTDYPTSTVVIPHITSKSNNSVSFALYGLDNQPRDAIVDVVIEYLPEGYMQGNNLLVR